MRNATGSRRRESNGRFVASKLREKRRGPVYGQPRLPRTDLGLTGKLRGMD